MGAKRVLRGPAAAQLAVGAIALITPATALAVSESSPATPAGRTTTSTVVAPSNTRVAPGSTTTEPAAAPPAHHAAPVVRAHTALAFFDSQTDGLVGHRSVILGRMRPYRGGRRVELQVRLHGRWRAIAAARTHSTGRFALRYRIGAVGNEAVRIAFDGDHNGTAAVSHPGTVTGLEDAEVSWYYDAGETACGFHATYGIASRTLPCGTKVTMSNGSRSVVATVDDRGPFVYSRLYDLNQNVAQALGMNGVGTVMASG